MTYAELKEKLLAYSEPEFADFQRRLIPTKQKILGVRTPVMRQIAKAYDGEIDELFSYPDEYYEITFIKLTVLSLQPYSVFLRYVDKAVSLMDNWSTCDCFRPKCLRKNKNEFLDKLKEIFLRGGEFGERYVFVCLLVYYAEEKYFSIIKDYMQRAHTQKYYVSTAVAWLLAELLIKAYPLGVELLESGMLDTKTHDRAIQKARESFRLSKERKEYLKRLKINKKGT